MLVLVAFAAAMLVVAAITGYIECQCFAGMLINFCSGEFLALRHDHF
jgi:hypothetical protein